MPSIFKLVSQSRPLPLTRTRSSGSSTTNSRIRERDQLLHWRTKTSRTHERAQTNRGRHPAAHDEAPTIPRSQAENFASLIQGNPISSQPCSACSSFRTSQSASLHQFPFLLSTITSSLTNRLSSFFSASPSSLLPVHFSNSRASSSSNSGVTFGRDMGMLSPLGGWKPDGICLVWSFFWVQDIESFKWSFGIVLQWAAYFFCCSIVPRMFGLFCWLWWTRVMSVKDVDLDICWDWACELDCLLILVLILILWIFVALILRSPTIYAAL